MKPVCLAVWALCAQPAVGCAQQLAAAEGGAAAADAQVVVTGSVAQRLAQEAPFAVTVVGRDALRQAGPLVNLSEALVQVPGLVVNNRSNYAQDLQISSRGFGARAGFGVRGLRLYSDGIPSSGPDGQGQVSNFDLANAQSVDVLRGPFSVLYGNSSGGVISLSSPRVTKAQAEAAVDGGSNGFSQMRFSVASPLAAPGWDVRLSASSMSTDGFRPQSAAQRSMANLRLGWQGAQDRVMIQAGLFDQPAQDALGLTRALFDANPYQTAPEAISFNTRKEQSQTQWGTSWRHGFEDAGALRESRLALWQGQRSVTQWQAIPAGSQANARHGGGVVDFDRRFDGLDARLNWSLGPVELLTGLALERQQDDRRGYENFTGTGASQVLGVTGKLRRNEDNRASTQDGFVQAEWTLNPAWMASLGVRSGQVKLSAKDAYLTNGDDSGDLSYRYTNPVLGLRWKLAPSWQLHASAARGFESPTLGELAYKPDGSAGFNTALSPHTSRQVELGSKWNTADLGLDVTVFSTQVNNELAVLTNTGGRSSFQNVGHTQRQGAELAGRWQISPAWRTQVVLTQLDATYRDAFKACAGTPCTAPTVAVPAGNVIAGTQPRSAWAELVWKDARWGEWGLEARSVGRTAVNDTNSDFAAAYAIASLRWSQQYALGGDRRLEVLLRVDNLSDKAYAGSVIVNDANGRYFEPGTPRSVLVGLRLLGGF